MTSSEPTHAATVDPRAIESFDGDPDLEQTHRNMVEAGHRVEDIIEIDYFGFSAEQNWYFPGQSKVPEDQKQYLVIKKMNEGDKAKYQKSTNRDIRIQRTTGDARMSVDAVQERHELIRISVVGAHVKRRMADGTLRFDDKRPDLIVKDWLEKGNPDHVQELERFIRDLNPWMKTEMSTDEIDKEIERLQELKREKAEEEAGN